MSHRRAHEIKLDDDDIEWLRQTYPGLSLSWIFTTMLKEFRLLHKTTPADLARLSAAELKEIVEERA